MQSSHKDILDQLRNEADNFPKKGPGIRYPDDFKNKVRMLFSEGVSRHELDKLLPVSAYSIDKWTKGIKKKSSKKNRKNNFSRVKITHDKDCISKNAISTNITIYHPSGFYIEIKDVNTFDFILQKIMGFSRYK